MISPINNPSIKISKDTIKKDLSVLTFRWLMGQSNTTNIYDALTGSGELGLIQSDEMRKLLGSLKGHIALLASYEVYQSNFVDNHLYPYLNQHIDGVTIANIRKAVMSERKKLDPARCDLSIKQGKFETAHKELMSSQYFYNLLLQHMNHTATLLPIYSRIKKYIVAIDSIILERNPSLMKEK